VTVGARWLLAAALTGAALVVVYAAAGGLDYRPATPPDPCQPRTWPRNSSFQEQAALSALDGAACKLGVSREQLGLAFTSQARLSRFQHEQGYSDGKIEDAARAGLLRAVDDGERSGRINGVEAFALRLAARVVPVDRVIQLVQAGVGT
jgi:hypothetical protein